ncbi:MAG: hypothetical protein IT198_00590 [Acidimicrobiia bacterium]|nr:hypothetical protein [Acidimicrobiia bacterium]
MDPLFRNMVEAASRAPSVYNSQPWCLRIAGGALCAKLDPTRLLPVLDPDNRLAWVSLGAAVENARLAALRTGCDVEVRWFESERARGDEGGDESETWPVVVAPVRMRGIAQADLELAGWIERQTVARGMMTSGPNPLDTALEAAAVSALPGARLVELPAGRRGLLVELTERVVLEGYTQPRLRREQLAWVRTLPWQRRDAGLRPADLVDSPFKRLLAPLVLSRPLLVPLGMGPRLAREARAVSASTLTFVVVTGTNGGPDGWFDSGRGWQRAALALAAYGYATDWPAAVLARAEATVRDLFEISPAEPVALLARIGVPARPVREATRRAPESMLR